MRRIKAWWSVMAAWVILAVANLSPASAGLLDLREIALTLESTLVDLDTTMIALHHGNDFSSHLNYVSRIDEAGWEGRLFGNYGGREVDIYYTGSLTLIGGPTSQVDISYVSDWYFDGMTGSGSGSGEYTDPEFSFDIDLQNMSVGGSISVEYGITSLTLAGVKDFGNHTLTVSGTAGAIAVPLLGNLAEAELALQYNQLTGVYESSATGRLLFGLWEESEVINKGTIRRPRNPPNPPPPPRRPNPPPSVNYPQIDSDPGFGGGSPGYNNMEVTSVPEPSTFFLAGMGICIAYVIHAQHRRSANCVAARKTA